jgi:hypothetical protein
VKHSVGSNKRNGLIIHLDKAKTKKLSANQLTGSTKSSMKLSDEKLRGKLASDDEFEFEDCWSEKERVGSRRLSPASRSLGKLVINDSTNCMSFSTTLQTQQGRTNKSIKAGTLTHILNILIIYKERRNLTRHFRWQQSELLARAFR